MEGSPRMSSPQESSTRVAELGQFRLGEWSIHPSEGTVSSDGQCLRLEPRVMDVLVQLAAYPGTVVSKEEILAAVWGGAFVEEGALSQAVHSLRKALGDDARQPRYIQTIPKRGYRLIAPVSVEPEPAEPVAYVAPVLPLAPTPTALSAPAPRHRWAWLLVSVAGIATILVLLLIDRRRPGEARTVPIGASEEGWTAAEEDGIRIAVLPFTEHGEPEDSFFLIGLMEEITRKLGSSSALQVIDRSTPLQGQDPQKSWDQIRAELAERGVDYVFLGTVHSEKGQVRIWPRLLKADGAQVWKDFYEVKSGDVFKIGDDISSRLIQSMGIDLQPEQARAFRKPSTESDAAYEAYLRGLEVKDQPFYSHEHLERAAAAFQRAVDEDPEFAAAWAELSQVHSYLAYNTDPTPDRIRLAREALEKAWDLDPALPEVQLARAYYTYRCHEDFDQALAQLEKAAELHPNHAETFKALGLLLRRKGRMAEALQALKHAAWLDPRTGELAWILPETHRAMRSFREADEGFEQAIQQVPDEPFFWEQKALNRLVWTGDVDGARRILEESKLGGDPLIEAAAFRLDLYEKEYEQALARLSPEWQEELPPETQARIEMMATIARERMGDHAGALAAAEANRAKLESLAARYPDRALYRACLAVALAQLGRRQEALAEIQEAVRIYPSDAFSGPRINEIQAMVDARLGRRREAIENLSRLIGSQYRGSITKSDLLLDPVWEALRGDADFRNIY